MSFVPGWNPKPFSTLALSASGVLALADLNTIAQRTAITGGASWIDTLLLAPGIHYQQAADELFRKGGASAIIDVVDEFAGSAVTFKLRNAATAHYIQNVAKPGETVTLDVGRAVSAKGRYKLRRSDSGNHATAWRETGPSDLGWVSHALYLTSPVRHVFADQGIAGRFVDWARDRLNTTVEIVRKPAEQRGFAVHPRRWVVERTLAWLTAHYPAGPRLRTPPRGPPGHHPLGRDQRHAPPDHPRPPRPTTTPPHVHLALINISNTHYTMSDSRQPFEVNAITVVP